MRIVIDLQSCQGLSKDRGMGRYSFSLAQAMAKVGKEHEIWIALNASFPEAIDRLRNAFAGLVPRQRVVVWHAGGPVAACEPGNTWRRETAETLREEFLGALRPDVIHVGSLFEGFVDDVVTSVSGGPAGTFASVTLYDLIPLVYEDIYLTDSGLRAWYYRKLQSLKDADLWLAISQHTRRDAIERLGFPEERVVNISTGIDSRFRPLQLEESAAASIRASYGLSRPFVLYTAGIDPRKNVESLVKAFSLLPRSLRDIYHLVVVCQIQEHDRERLLGLALQVGLQPHDVVFTGFVPDEELVALYNLSCLFVFPSLYEGFGLPAAEAMACGAAVIASNTSSLPEVVGWEEALFDPGDVEAIAGKMHEALADESFREALRRNGLQQAQRFSWEESARRALEAFEAFYGERASAKSDLTGPRFPKPRLAYVSPLPPARSGIADYSREMIPQLARYYRIELVVDQPEVSNPEITASFPVRTAEWFASNATRYDRILYHFGNSEFHKHMFGLLKKHPGVVVLHDFYLSHALFSMERTWYAPGIFRSELYHSHGYAALAELNEKEEEGALWNYPCNWSVLEGADGIVVHSRHAMELANRWYADGTARDWRLVPFPRRALLKPDRSLARRRLGLSQEEFVVCSFGLLTPAKLPALILEAWLVARLRGDRQWRLVFVGEPLEEVLAAKLRARASEAGALDYFEITGHVSRELYESYLAAADVAVQLRTKSRGETSASALDCLAAGLSTVVNAHGWSAEIPDSVVIKLPEQVGAVHLAGALEELCENQELRQRLGKDAREHIERVHTPYRVAEAYFQAIERFAQTGPHARRCRLIRSIAENDGFAPSRDEDLVATAVAIAGNLQGNAAVPQVLIDVSLIAQQDNRTGIQRVTRTVLKELAVKRSRLRFEPVRAEPPGIYRYARHFMANYFGLPSPGLPDDLAEARPGDIFLGLDFAPHLVPGSLAFFSRIRAQGVLVYFVCYDLLPMKHPEWFSDDIHPLHLRWLETIACVADGVVCISRSVADQLFDWLDSVRPQRNGPLSIGYFHLGADTESIPVPSGEADEAAVREALSLAGSIFLMVGTLEPRKGYSQVLEAFEELWRVRKDLCLVIVGKQGWRVERLVERIRKHAELGERLFWLDQASDETLHELYRKATALLMASRDEGFGLPLVEAARQGLPIIARDIPVFREVCGNHAFYFRGESPVDLSRAIVEWLAMSERAEAPSVQGMKCLTWEQAAEQLLEAILASKWYRVWNHSR